MTQTVPDISPLMPMHEDPLLVHVYWPRSITEACELVRNCASMTIPWILIIFKLDKIIDQIIVKSSNIYDDVMKWKHFPRHWLFVWVIHRSSVYSPGKGQWRGALMLSLICAWINRWVNNRKAGDLRRHHDHYDVIVMIVQYCATIA